MWLKGKGLQTWSLPPPSAGPPLRGAIRWDRPELESLDISSDTPTARPYPLHIETKWGIEGLRPNYPAYPRRHPRHPGSDPMPET